MQAQYRAQWYQLRLFLKHVLALDPMPGAMLDIDHGTYPYVTSSNTTAGGVSTGAGIGPKFIDYILGVTKAYCTRVGAGPMPTQLDDEVGQYLAEKGQEWGTVTGRKRRCGWFDVPLMRQCILARCNNETLSVNIGFKR